MADDLTEVAVEDRSQAQCEADPDCDRCDDTQLDPDAYIPHETEHGTAYRHAPCRDCQPEAWEAP